MNSLGNNRYQMLFIDDDADDFGAGQLNLMKQTDAGQQKTKQQRNNKKMMSTHSDKAKDIVVNNENKELIANQKPMGPNMVETEPDPVHLQQEQPQLECQQRRSYNNNSSNERVYPTRIFRQSKVYGAYNAATAGSNTSNNKNNPRLENRKFDHRSGSDKTDVQAAAKPNGASQDVEAEEHKQESQAATAAAKNANEDEQVKHITTKKYGAMRSEGAQPSRTNCETNGLGCDAPMYPQRGRRQQRVVDIEFTFNYNARRTEQCRGHQPISQVAAGKEQPVDVQDTTEFPTLGLALKSRPTANSHTINH